MVACPTGRSTALVDIAKAKMGLAVLIDQENCLNFLGLRCDVCYRVCPVIDQAITLERMHNPRSDRHAMLLPTVHSEHCTGCGKCEKACVLPGEAAIKVLPIKLAQGSKAEHYLRGWKRRRPPASRSSATRSSRCAASKAKTYGDTRVEPGQGRSRCPRRCRITFPRSRRAVVSTRGGSHERATRRAGGVPERKVPPTSVRGAAMRGVVARPGREAVEAKGWLRAHKWLLLRRASQLGILALFLVGPWLGWWIVKGNLSSSLTLGVLPLTDPFLVVQQFAAGQWSYREALLGAGIVLAFYLLFGGRLFCSWVCPVNLVTDAAAWLRRRLLWGGKVSSGSTRYWLLGFVLVIAAATGSLAWEWVNRCRCSTAA